MAVPYEYQRIPVKVKPLLQSRVVVNEVNGLDSWQTGSSFFLGQLEEWHRQRSHALGISLCEDNVEKTVTKTRQLTAFFKFSKEMRQEVKAAHPDLSVTGIAKVLGKLWRNLSELEKEKYKIPQCLVVDDPKKSKKQKKRNASSAKIAENTTIKRMNHRPKRGEVLHTKSPKITSMTIDVHSDTKSISKMVPKKFEQKENIRLYSVEWLMKKKLLIPWDDSKLEYTNDLCQKCGLGGDLLMCSFCNLTWHMQCIPDDQKLPQTKHALEPDSEADWACKVCFTTALEKAHARFAPSKKKSNKKRAQKSKTSSGNNKKRKKNSSVVKSTALSLPRASMNGTKKKRGKFDDVVLCAGPHPGWLLNLPHKHVDQWYKKPFSSRSYDSITQYVAVVEPEVCKRKITCYKTVESNVCFI